MLPRSLSTGTGGVLLANESVVQHPLQSLVHHHHHAQHHHSLASRSATSNQAVKGRWRRSKPPSLWAPYPPVPSAVEAGIAQQQVESTDAQPGIIDSPSASSFSPFLLADFGARVTLERLYQLSSSADADAQPAHGNAAQQHDAQDQAQPHMPELQHTQQQHAAALQHVFQVTTEDKPAQRRNQERSPDYFANVGDAIRTLREDIPELFNNDLNYSIYRDDIVFKDPRNKFSGIKNYKTIFWSLRFHGRIFFTRLYVEVKRIWQPSDDVIKMRWTVHGIPRVPWEAEGLFDGISTYKLDNSGRVYEHSVDNVLLRDPPPLANPPLLAGLNLVPGGAAAPQQQPYPGGWCLSCDEGSQQQELNGLLVPVTISTSSTANSSTAPATHTGRFSLDPTAQHASLPAAPATGGSRLQRSSTWSAGSSWSAPLQQRHSAHNHHHRQQQQQLRQPSTQQPIATPLAAAAAPGSRSSHGAVAAHLLLAHTADMAAQYGAGLATTLQQTAAAAAAAATTAATNATAATASRAVPPAATLAAPALTTQSEQTLVQRFSWVRLYAALYGSMLLAGAVRWGAGGSSTNGGDDGGCSMGSMGHPTPSPSA